nr:rho GDP-dissociation inhibitor 1-like [Ipomoea batatas]GMC75511.1 rho GDP-dissociation inhibitor 1-like [Ipomoea batatas]GMC76434.1 rho GDP-dissociation inhibitor 1-like [Ipomoea batatas]GMC76520.1 rho GDP-dissociation inhibitor 1-like [Ipomoea batatas]
MDNESDGGSGRMSRPPSEVSLCPTEDEEDFTPMGPKCSIKEHLEKDKAKAQEPDVKILSLTIISTDRPDIVLQMPESGSPKGLWFTLKEGSKYRLRFEIKVSNEIVCGLRYINTVWKTGLKVDGSKEMLGTFSPQAEPYTHEMPEETTPSGMFARGTYSARTKFIDDDKKCYLDINYTFDIQKDWATTS